MYQTYELYVRGELTGEPRFEPATCRTAAEVMTRARALLDQDDRVSSVEVRLAGQHLFTLER